MIDFDFELEDCGYSVLFTPSISTYLPQHVLAVDILSWKIADTVYYLHHQFQLICHNMYWQWSLK